MTDVIDKKAALRRYFPRPFYQFKPVGGDGWEVVLDAVGDQLNIAADEVANARAQFLLATAEGIYLQVHGVNVDILRPRGFNMTDARFRSLIEIITNSPKNIEQIFERLIVLFFGPTAISSGLVDVYSYRNHEIVCEIDHSALIIASTRTLLGTTYLHRDPADPYTGNVQASWSTTLAAPALTTDTQITLTSVAGVPVEGIAEIGGSPLIKGFPVRSGNVLTLLSPIGTAFPAGTVVRGPQTPDNYPNGYVYNRDYSVDLGQTIVSGATQVLIGTLTDGFPEQGVVYLGDPLGPTFEAKGFTRMTGPNRLVFDGPVTFNHIAGEEAVVPTITRKVKTTLAQSITAGTTLGPSGEMSVGNSADFGLVRQAIKIDNGGNAEETVPFISRKVGDNTKVLVDPDYVFLHNHAPGERVNLMARQTEPRINGFDYAFFINDTDSLRVAFFNLLRRVKVTGCKLVFVVK